MESPLGLQFYLVKFTVSDKFRHFKGYSTLVDLNEDANFVEVSVIPVDIVLGGSPMNADDVVVVWI